MWDTSEERLQSIAVLEAVADAKGVDPLELSPPLAEVINPAALNELFWETHSTGRVVFEYVGYEVTVHNDGTVDIDALSQMDSEDES